MSFPRMYFLWKVKTIFSRQTLKPLYMFFCNEAYDILIFCYFLAAYNIIWTKTNNVEKISFQWILDANSLKQYEYWPDYPYQFTSNWRLRNISTYMYMYHQHFTKFKYQHTWDPFRKYLFHLVHFNITFIFIWKRISLVSIFIF